MGLSQIWREWLLKVSPKFIRARTCSRAHSHTVHFVVVVVAREDFVIHSYLEEMYIYIGNSKNNCFWKIVSYFRKD